MNAHELYGKLSYPIRISASALNDFGTCPQRFLYSRHWKSIGEEPQYFQLGREVHEIMEGSLDPADALPDAADKAQRLAHTERGLGINIFHRELRQTFDVVPDFQLTRIIDALGVDKDGKPLIIDYKTSRVLWATTGPPQHMAYKANSWQSICYLLPPPKDVWKDEWPKQIAYLVVSNKSVQYFPVDYSVELAANFYQALGIVKHLVDIDGYYKNCGWTCKWCPYQNMCFNVDGWEDKYERR